MSTSAQTKQKTKKEKIMRGKKAKAIRRAVYSDNSNSIKAKRTYVIANGVIENQEGTLRARYQKAKKEARIWVRR